MPLSPKTRLGTYEIVGPLGAGGMGEVYRAKDLRLGRDVAVKVLPQTVASSPDRLARFEREARTVAGLNHPNIVTLHSVEDEEGIRFLTMELVEGQTLSNLVTPGGLPLSRVLELSIPLTDALAAAHERGVIHRDLKPGNVMVTREGRVKVLDFGLAKTPEEEEEPRRLEVSQPHEAPLEATTFSPLSGAGQVLGTLPYMAPEQLRGEPVDARSDLFAVGIILYELATGRRPFNGETPAEVSSAILLDPPAPPTRLRPDLPPEFERVVLRCLEKNPRQRAESALFVSNDLRGLRRVLERGEAETPVPEKTASIAVLPFVNRSASVDDEYFSDGLTDELLGTLAKIGGLHVAARTSSFQFKGTKDDIATIGRKLKVATLLEGSVRKSGNRVRISVQLVKVSDGFHVWSETYDRTLDDIFAVQDDIAQSVVKELRATLLGREADSDASGQAKAEVARAAKGRSSDPEAHRLYLMGRYLVDRWTREDVAKSIDHLKEALTRDPRFAVAWAELSRAYAAEAGCGWVPVAEGNARARAAAERALMLEPDLEDGHVRLGWIRMTYDWDWRGAETTLARAFELAPGDERVIHMSAVLARNLGNLDEAIALNRRALERDPLSSASYLNLGLNLFAADRHAEAEAAFRDALEFAPEGTVAHASLSLALLAQGRHEESLAEALREPEESLRLYALSIVHATAGRPGDADAALREFVEKHAENAATQIAEAHAVRGDADAAFEWLERAFAQRDGGLTEMMASPHFRPLHGDPRWGAFLKRMGFGT
ncbi:MAG TPA: protein kinase [Candidatus Eisenbacteria bacterium]|nr:protein kinase [Candidatus Eisenbacteria bacterium]